MKFIGIIPARYASTRFPAKPLAVLGGKPVIQRVYEQVAGILDEAYVATDDERIESAVKAFGGKVVMTSVHHKSGTDRCYEAYTKVGQGYDVVVNIQGDEQATSKQKEKAKAFVLRNETDGKIKGVLNQAKTFQGVNFIESDRDDYLFNTPEATINLRNLNQKKHDRRDLITQCSNYSFNRENDKCPNWIAFLNRIFCGDQELINYVQKAVGYSLTGDMSEQCLFMLWGGGANGKSTFDIL